MKPNSLFHSTRQFSIEKVIAVIRGEINSVETGKGGGRERGREGGREGGRERGREGKREGEKERGGEGGTMV